jgi:hypothetical protein
MFSSMGTLQYVENPFKVIVEVDPDLVRYYRSFIPKSVIFNIPLYSPHISVVRNEVIPNPQFWGKYEGEIITFDYEGEIGSSLNYYWLNVFSQRLEDIRTELGLPNANFPLSPANRKYFHITLANLKEHPKPRKT